jgi:histidinol-phosphate phosphatase family protein
MNHKVPVSVVVIAKNEEADIEECLKSVYGWAEEIIVVDDHSTDRTPEIAKKYATVITKKMENEGIHRNWANNQAKNDWVLILDGDQKVTPEFLKEAAGAVRSDEYVYYDAPLKNYIGNYWVRYGGWYPAHKIRLLRKNKVRFEEVVVHPRLLADGKGGHLKSDVIHKGYADLEHYTASLNRQTTLEARKWIDTKRRMSCGHMIWRAVDRFFRRYVRKCAWKDGMYGFVIAYYDSLYQLLSYVKYREMIRNEKRSPDSGKAVSMIMKPAIFIDRDGVINRYPGDRQYVTAPCGLEILPGTKAALEALSASPYALFIVSNQAGVSKGLYTQETLEAITEKMLSELGGRVRFDGILYCTHKEEENCSCRKPRIGAIHKAERILEAAGLRLDTGASFFVGDSLLDVETAHNAGIRSVLVMSGRNNPGNPAEWKVKPDHTVRDLREAVEKIILK